MSKKHHQVWIIGILSQNTFGCIKPSCTKREGGEWDEPLKAFKLNSAENQQKLAKVWLIEAC